MYVMVRYHGTGTTVSNNFLFFFYFNLQLKVLARFKPVLSNETVDGIH